MYANGLSYVPYMQAVPTGMMMEGGTEVWSQQTFFVPVPMENGMVGCAQLNGDLSLACAPFSFVPPHASEQQLGLEQPVELWAEQPEGPWYEGEEGAGTAEGEASAKASRRNGRKRRGRRNIARSGAAASEAEAAELPDAADEDAFPSLGVSAASAASSAGHGGLRRARAGSWSKWSPEVAEEADGRGEAQAKAEAKAEECRRDDVCLCPLPGHAQRSAGELAEDSKLCLEVIALLDPKNGSFNEQVLKWVFPSATRLALAEGSCRLIQKLLSVLSAASRDRLTGALVQHWVELYESRNGNHVLQKVIEVTPSTDSEILPLLIEKILAKKGPTKETEGPIAVARHQYGCRVLERLIEHCTEGSLGALVERYVASVDELCRHQYGNFVIQHLLEHGSDELRLQINRQLLKNIEVLSTHRTASHVVQMALQHSPVHDQISLATGIFGTELTLLDMAASRYGSYVVQELLDLPFAAQGVRRRLVEASEQHKQSPAFQRVAEKAGLALLPMTPGAAAASLPLLAQHQQPSLAELIDASGAPLAGSWDSSTTMSTMVPVSLAEDAASARTTSNTSWGSLATFATAAAEGASASAPVPTASWASAAQAC